MRLIFAILIIAQSLHINAVAQNSSSEVDALLTFDLSTPKGFSAFRKAGVALAERGEGTEQILQIIEGEPESRRRSLMRAVVEEMVDNDAATIAAWLVESPSSRIHFFDVDSARGLARFQPLPMINLAQKVCPLKPLPPLEENDSLPEAFWASRREVVLHSCWFEKAVVNGAFNSLAQLDIEIALKEASHWRDYRDYFSTAMVDIVSVWGSTDLIAAERYINQLAAGEYLKDELFAALAMYRDPVELGKQRLSAQRPAMLSKILKARLSTGTMEETAEWVVGHSDQATVVWAMSFLCGPWIKADSEGALNWAAGLPAGKVRDAACLGLIRRHNGVVASSEMNRKMLNLADLIGDPKDNESAVSSVITKWSINDSEGAKKALDSLKQP